MRTFFKLPSVKTAALTALVFLLLGSCSNLLVESGKVDEIFVQTDKANLSLGLAPGDTLSSITQDITVPDSIEEGTTVTWTSSDPDAISTDGAVTRPAFDAGSRTVTLTATLVTGTASATKAFSLVVLPVEPTDAEAVASAKAAIAIGYAAGDSAAGIRQNVTLPATGLWGTTVAWSRTAGTAIDPSDGSVTRPAYLAGNTTVSLQATVTKNAESGTKDFNALVVVRLPGTDTECVAEDKASLAIGYTAGDSAASVTQAITLATSGTNDTVIGWSSNNAAVASDGTVTRPAYSSGNATVTLTATITKAGSSDTMVFTVTVIKLPQTDSEAVADGKVNLAITYGGSDTADSVTVNLVTLPPTGTSGTTVAWTTNDPAHVTAAGVVTRPAYVDGASDATVILTATITKGGATDTQLFTLTVKELPDPDQLAVDAAWVALVITYGGVDTAASVTQSVTLPTTGASGTSVSWSSNSTGYITNTGALVNHGVNTEVNVTLTATITKGTRSRPKEFILTVIRWPAGVPTTWTIAPAGPIEMNNGIQTEIRVTVKDARGTFVTGLNVGFNSSFGASAQWYEFGTGYVTALGIDTPTDGFGVAVTFFVPPRVGIGDSISYWAINPSGGNYFGPITVQVNSR